MLPEALSDELEEMLQLGMLTPWFGKLEYVAHVATWWVVADTSRSKAGEALTQKMSVRDVAEAQKRLAHAVLAPPLEVETQELLRDAAARLMDVVERRNALVHSLWLRPSDGSEPGPVSMRRLLRDRTMEPRPTGLPALLRDINVLVQRYENLIELLKHRWYPDGLFAEWYPLSEEAPELDSLG